MGTILVLVASVCRSTFILAELGANMIEQCVSWKYKFDLEVVW